MIKFNPGDKLIEEKVILPKLSYVIICASLGFQPPMALVTRRWASGRRQSGYQLVQLNSNAP